LLLFALTYIYRNFFQQINFYPEEGRYILPKRWYPSTKLQTIMCKERRVLKSVMNTEGLQTD